MYCSRVDVMDMSELWERGNWRNSVMGKGRREMLPLYNGGAQTTGDAHRSGRTKSSYLQTCAAPRMSALRSQCHIHVAMARLPTLSQITGQKIRLIPRPVPPSDAV